jgi:hypothetical protein
MKKAGECSEMISVHKRSNVRQTQDVAGLPTSHRERSEDGEGGIKPAMCRRPRAVLRPMLALFVVGT